jgi:hypothetical protein
MVSLNSFPYLGLGSRPVSRVPSPAGYWPALDADTRIQTASWPDAVNGQVITLRQGDLSRRRNARIAIIAMRHGCCDG